MGHESDDGVSKCSPYCRGCYLEDRHKLVVEAGRIETSDLERLGFKGRGGFLGKGVYGNGNRKPGYRRQG